MSTIDNPFYGTFVFPTPVAVVNTLQPSAQPTIAQLPILTSLAPDGRFESEQSSLVPTYVSQELAVSVTELLADGEECPIGFLCDADRKANCTILRGLPISLGFGDIHAGLMCPANVSDYRNCPVGKYCPTPELVFECPEGKFCPHKTAEPTIDCNQCSVGSVQLERARYGYTLMIVLFVIVFCLFVWRVMKAANKKRYDEFVELANRRVSSIRLETYRSQRRNKLEKIKPRLDLIAARLRSSQEIFQAELSREPPVSGSASGSTSLPFTTSKSKSAVELHMDGTITFDARRLFDKVDTNGDGVLSYKELNLILELDTVALQEFVRRMNEGAGVSADCKYISRRVFVWHFVDVLAEASNFGPTAAEAAQLFDEIAERGINRNGEIEPETFYTSSLSRFLTDSQIHNLLVRLRSRQLERSSGKPSAWVPVQTSIRALTDINRRDRPSRAIRRDDFIAHYPTVLYEIVTEPDSLPFVSTCRPDIIPEQHEGVDIAFEELSLTVNVGGNTINVVDKVTGRLRAGTMTALMGGSGAGKSSLLNALCGRAFYGETSGTILVNGHLSTIEEHRDSVGFVPQDDIVYSELTVKENFMYAAKFQLDARTSLEDIEDLADATLANLGLSRVANSIVGDVNRRGVSGGEKKRVNIGLELMSRPRALFLDEPTSGLDSSSALLVMQSLRVLVENQGVTVCSVIHQPRKVIFDLFDDLILLGVGGKLVYNGPTEGAQKYVERLNYRLPPGDSVADWLIDVSSGRLEPEDVENETHGIEDSSEPIAKKRNFSQEEEYDHNAGPSSNKVEQEFEEAKIRREMLYESWSTHFDKLPGEDRARYSAPKPYALPEPVKRSSFLKQLTFQLRRNVLVTRRNSFSKLLDTFLIVGAVVLISAFEGVVEVTASSQPDVSFDALVSGDPLELAEQLPELFLYAIRGSNRLQE
jgi:ABC-type multidrug transport system ATPase subunit